MQNLLFLNPQILSSIFNQILKIPQIRFITPITPDPLSRIYRISTYIHIILNRTGYRRLIYITQNNQFIILIQVNGC